MSCSTLLPVCYSDEDEGLTTPPWCVDASELCEVHEDGLSMFCLDDLEPLCKQCAAESHAGHRVYPLTEAATDCKEELKTSFNVLKIKMVRLEKASQTWEHASRYNNAEAKPTEEQIKTDFESLHQFLREEEAERLRSLRESQEEKRRASDEQINRMDQVIRSLEEKITLMEGELDREGDGAGYLENYKDTMNSTCSGNLESLQVCPPLDVSKHLGNLQYVVWEKMRNITPYTPVTFDPRTAGHSLTVSPGLHTVHFTPGPSQGLAQTGGVCVPENPERFTQYSCILGREGFDSGVHCWDIEVGDTSDWTLGVAAQSVSRKTKFEVCPEAGLWCISLRDGKYQALTHLVEDLVVDSTPHKVHVRLDWDEGTLRFKNADTNAHLFIYRHRFKEKLYPYFKSTAMSGGITVLGKRVNVSSGSENIPVEDTEEDQLNKSGSQPDGRKNRVSSTYSSSTMSEQVHQKKTKPKKGNMNGKQVKTKTSEKEKTKNKPDAKKQSRKPKFNVTYPVSLNRALKILNKESDCHKQDSDGFIPLWAAHSRCRLELDKMDLPDYRH